MAWNFLEKRDEAPGGRKKKGLELFKRWNEWKVQFFSVKKLWCRVGGEVKQEFGIKEVGKSQIASAKGWRSKRG